MMMIRFWEWNLKKEKKFFMLVFCFDFFPDSFHEFIFHSFSESDGDSCDYLDIKCTKYESCSLGGEVGWWWLKEKMKIWIEWKWNIKDEKKKLQDEKLSSMMTLMTIMMKKKMKIVKAW